MDAILPSWKIWICACPSDSVSQAGTSMSDRIWVLNTIGGASSLATLLANPGNFYVNFHSDHCPGGIARGFLP